jgi:hypothetical protein
MISTVSCEPLSICNSKCTSIATQTTVRLQLKGRYFPWLQLMPWTSWRTLWLQLMPWTCCNNKSKRLLLYIRAQLQRKWMYRLSSDNKKTKWTQLPLVSWADCNNKTKSIATTSGNIWVCGFNSDLCKNTGIGRAHETLELKKTWLDYIRFMHTIF